MKRKQSLKESSFVWLLGKEMFPEFTGLGAGASALCAVFPNDLSLDSSLMDRMTHVSFHTT